MSGGRNVFAVARSIWTDSDFAPEPFTEREAWIWLISSAAWKDTRARGNAGPVDLRRAEFSFSVRFLATKFQWTKDKTHRFLKRLEKRDTIRDTSRDGAQIYYINKYNHFQVVGLPKRDSDCDSARDADATAARQHRDKEEALKQGNKEEEEQEDAVQQSKPAQAIVAATPLPVWMPIDAWTGFLEMRRRLRKPPTDRAIHLLIQRIEKWVLAGHDPTEILDASTRNNWTDLYEPKTGTTHGNARKPSAHDRFNAGASAYIASLGDDDEPGRQGPPHGDADGAGVTLLAT